jgi:hypothetical protein
VNSKVSFQSRSYSSLKHGLGWPTILDFWPTIFPEHESFPKELNNVKCTKELET